MIYVECNPDETLVKILGFSRKQITHAFGKGNICNKLEKTKNTLGLVDEDPQSAQPKYLKRLKPRKQEDGIKVWQDTKRGNFIVMLCPRLEGWITQVSKKDKLDITKYQLPNDADRLHGKINLQSEKFEKFLIDALPVSTGLKNLQRILKELHQSLWKLDWFSKTL